MCACAWQGHVCWLAPHTDWCPQVGRNFLEIVSNHRSRGVMRGPWAGVQCVCAWHACPQVKVKNIPYRHRTLRSSAGRVLIIGQACSVRGVCGRAGGVGGQVGGRGGGGGEPWERRWHSTSFRMTSAATSRHLQGCGRSLESEGGTACLPTHRGVDGEDSTLPKAGPVLVRMREALHVCWLLTRSCVLT